MLSQGCDMSSILMIIAHERFRDEELFQPLQEFERKGHQVIIASTRTGRCAGSRGGFAEAQIILTDIDTALFDVVVFVGGGGATRLFDNPDAHRIAREMASQKKIVAAICLAPVILARAGILKGRHATVSGQKAAEIETLGTTYSGPGVTIDGNIITANAPKASLLFGQKICEELSRPPNS